MDQHNNFLFQYNPRESSGAYGTNIYIEKDLSKQCLQSINTIQYVGKLTPDKYAFHVYKTDLLVNGIEPDEHVYRLANECSKSCFPLTVITNNKGLHEMVRTDDIVERWPIAREKIEREFQGEGSNIYMKNIEQVIKNPIYITRMIERDLFFNLYFGLIYGMSDSKAVKKMIPIIPFAEPVSYFCNQTVHFDSSEELIILTRGKFNDERDYTVLFPKDVSIRNGETSLTGICNIEYVINKKQNLISAIKGEFNIFSNGNKMIDTHISSYYLEEIHIDPIVDKFIENEYKSKYTPKHWWNIL